MKVFIQTDMEGVSGATNGGYGCRLSPEEKTRYLELMMGEINAVVEGCVAAGADEIIVKEAHNIDLAKLHPEAKLARGISIEQAIGLRHFDAAMFVGQHARTDLADAVRSHTGSSKSIVGFWINGQPAGELGYCAGLFGECGIPIVFLSGDTAACAEAETLIPGIVTTAVEESVSIWGALCLPPAKTRPLLMAGARKALANASRIKPVQYDLPVTIRVEYAYPMIADAHALIPGTVRINARTVEYTGRTYSEAFRGGVAVLASILYRYDA